jgi:hypothetical protein
MTKLTQEATMQRYAPAICAFFALLALTTAIADEPMRCGSWIVTSDATVEELTHKCGTPAAKAVSTADVYTPRINGNGTRKTGETTTERWTYDRGPEAFRIIVTIVDGKIRSIERAT